MLKNVLIYYACTMILNRIRVSTRLTLSYAGLLVLFSIVTWFAVHGLRESRADYYDSVTQGNQVTLATTWADSTRLNVNRVLAIAQSGKAPAVDAHFAPLIAKTTEEINGMQKRLEASVDGDEAKAAFQSVGGARTSYIAQRKAYFDALSKDGPDAAKKALDEGLMPAAERYMALQTKFLTVLENERIAKSKEAEQQIAGTVQWVIALAVGAFFFGGAVAFFMVRSITTPIGKAMAASKRIAENDLSGNIHVVCEDEFGTLRRTMQSMQEALRVVVTNIRESSDNLATTSQEIASGGMELSARTEQAASNLEETAASMEQLTATVKHSADASKQANDMAAQAAGVASKGGNAMKSVAAKMGDIETSGKRIADIIGVIDGIAFQTNILALNAAVEAARAGEQGRGFAVVASEVRSLAKRSADAAKEIKVLIEASVSDIRDGSQQVQAAENTMQDVVKRVQMVSEMVAQITLATGEQSSGIAQVNQAVSQLDQMTQQNAALVEESSAAAEGLREQAARLGEAVAVFRT